MKIPNQLKTPGFVVETNRLKPGAGLALNRTGPASEADVLSKGIRSKHEGPGPMKLRIENFFYHAPTARTVQLAGDFTNWLERPINLRKGSQGTWWKAVRLKAGTHYYRFLVDGQWRDDPECSLCVPNAFGSQNCVRQVH